MSMSRHAHTQKSLDLLESSDRESFVDSFVAAENLGHAYLLVGQNQAGRMQAALRIAQIALCKHAGCGTCEDCESIRRGSHPDLHVVQPQSSQGYLLEQIRTLIEDLALYPLKASHKVFIITEAQALAASGGAPGNALLKSLEEPPGDTVFILCATSKEAVIPTIASRCRILHIPAFNPTHTAERTPLGGLEDKKLYEKALEVVQHINTEDEIDLLSDASAMLEAIQASLEGLRQRQQTQLDAAKEILSPAAMKKLSKQYERELAHARSCATIDCLRTQRALFRDAILLREGASQDLFCKDFRAASTNMAQHLQTSDLLKSIACIERAIARIERGTSAHMTLEAMLLELKEIQQCR